MSDQLLALIIEDDEDTSEIFAAALQTAGFVTEVVGDGSAALKRLEEVDPSLVLLDLHLPHTSGKEILNHIRTDMRLGEIPVILATADHRLASEIEGDANFVLIKPISFNQLSILTSRLYERYTRT